MYYICTHLTALTGMYAIVESRGLIATNTTQHGRAIELCGHKKRARVINTANFNLQLLPRIIHNTGAMKPLKPELNPICYLLALLGAHHLFHVSRIRVKLLTLR